MRVPSFCFIDTSIYRGEAFDFGSRSFRQFSEHFTGKGVTLLIPDVIEQEVLRHIKSLAEQAGSELKKLGKNAPLLRQLGTLPLERKEANDAAAQLRDTVLSKFVGFLERHQAVRLAYDLIDLTAVMGWFHSARPPFEKKDAKRWEFPDAFAIAALDAFHNTHKHRIAVITKDGGIQEACLLREFIDVFPDIVSYVNADKNWTEQFIAVGRALGDYSVIAASIMDSFADLEFLIRQSVEGYVEQVVASECKILEINMTDVAQQVVSLAFKCVVRYEAFVSYLDRTARPDVPEDMLDTFVVRYQGVVADRAYVSGIVECFFDRDAEKLEVGRLLFDDNPVVVDADPDYNDLQKTLA